MGVCLSLVAPPGVAPGTSAVPVCAHKEHKDLKELAQAERMSGATWRSRAPSIGACLIVCVSVFCLKGLMHDE